MNVYFHKLLYSPPLTVTWRIASTCVDFCAARMSHDDVLVCIVARKVHVVGQFAHMEGARHTGVFISNVKPIRVEKNFI